MDENAESQIKAMEERLMTAINTKDEETKKMMAEQEKRDALEFALKENIIPEMCNKEETWDGVKCKSYCPVSEACIYYEGE